MMTQIEPLFQTDSESWLAGLPQYQLKIINELRMQNYTPEQIASLWLSVSPQHTFVFGTSGERTADTQPFIDSLLKEVEAFLCGDVKYENDRMNLLTATPTHTSLVAAISAAVASGLGTAPVFVAPVIALLLMGIRSAGIISLNAWCQMRKEKSSGAHD